MDPSTSIIPQDLQTPAQWTDEQFSEIAKGGDWLPRLQLFGSNSKAVKQGKFPMAHYGLVHSEDNIVDLGENVDIYVLGWRPKARDFSDAEAGLIQIFDPTNAEFARITEKSTQQDSECMSGPEFLVYVPSLKAFATFYMASKTAKNEAPKMKPLIGGTATLQVRYIESGKFGWHGPVVKPQSSPLEPPDTAKVRKELERFNNPVNSDVESVPTPAPATNESERPR